MKTNPSIIIIGCGITALVFVFVLLLARVVTLESCHHLIGGISHKEAAVIREFAYFKYGLRALESNEEPPPGELKQVLAVFKGPHDCHYLHSGIDPWGNPWVYRVRRENEFIYRVTLRSIGPNGRDEIGIGDDLQFDLEMGIVK